MLILLVVGAAITLLAIGGVILAALFPSAHAEPPAAPLPAPEPRRAAPRLAEVKRAEAQPMVVTQMATRGFLGIEDARGKREEPLPESPLGHGEFPMGLWVAPDHTAFAVGKLYTGRPGPDEGVVWRRTRDASWSFALRLPTRVIGDVTGRSPTEIVAGTMGGILCFDGQTWREHALPYAMMWKVWSEGDELIAQAFDGSATYTVTSGVPSMTTARPEPRRDRYTFVRDGVTYRVFDRSTPVGERTLDPREEAEIKRELAEVQRMIAEGKTEGPWRV